MSQSGSHSYKTLDYHKKCFSIHPILDPVINNADKVNVVLCSFGLGEKFGLIGNVRCGLHRTENTSVRDKIGLFGMKVSNNPKESEWGAGDAQQLKKFYLNTISNAAAMVKTNSGDASIVVCNEYSFPSFFGDVPPGCEVSSIKADLQKIANKTNCIIFSGTANICCAVEKDLGDPCPDTGFHVGFLFYPKRTSRLEFCEGNDDVENYKRHHYKVYKYQRAQKKRKDMEGYTSPGNDTLLSVFQLNSLAFGVSICADFIAEPLKVKNEDSGKYDYISLFDCMKFESGFSDLSPSILFVPAKDNSGSVMKHAKSRSDWHDYHVCVANSIDDIEAEGDTLAAAVSVYENDHLVSIDRPEDNLKIFLATKTGSLTNVSQKFRTAAKDEGKPIEAYSLRGLKEKGKFLSVACKYELDCSKHHNNRFERHAKKHFGSLMRAGQQTLKEIST